MKKMNDTINDQVRMIHWNNYIENNVLTSHKWWTQTCKTFQKYVRTTGFEKNENLLQHLENFPQTSVKTGDQTSWSFWKYVRMAEIPNIIDNLP